MDPAFFRTPYSFHFNALKIFGAWPLDNGSLRFRKFFVHYSHFMFGLVVFFIYMGILDFIEARNDFRKISWNLCVNLIIILTVVKNVNSFYKADTINGLRRKLYRPFKTCKNVKEVTIFKNNLKIFRKLALAFYCPFIVFYPIWAVDALYLYLKLDKTPLPSKWIYDIDKDHVVLRVCQYFIHVTFAGLFLFHAMTTDLAMFGIMFQMYREYEFLLCEVEDFEEFHQIEDKWSIAEENELNRIPIKRNIKLKLRKIIDRQKEIIEFTEEFENSYNKSMMLQIFVGGVLLLMNCVQTLTLSLEFSLKTTPQGTYSLVMVMDAFIVCFLSNRISDKCRQVGNILYDLPWYAMDIDLRKDIFIIIMRSQKPPKITSGKLFELDVETFSEVIKNIYRYVATFRQLGFR